MLASTSILVARIAGLSLLNPDLVKFLHLLCTLQRRDHFFVCVCVCVRAPLLGLVSDLQVKVLLVWGLPQNNPIFISSQ